MVQPFPDKYDLPESDGTSYAHWPRGDTAFDYVRIN
jgi:hypothetical protein